MKDPSSGIRRRSPGPGGGRIVPCYRHRKAVKGGDPERIEKHFPRVQRVAALLKRWLLETHRGAVRKRHTYSFTRDHVFKSASATSSAIFVCWNAWTNESKGC